MGQPAPARDGAPEKGSVPHFHAWSVWSSPVAYLYEQQTKPFIIEEDTASAGSRVAIHDSSIFLSDYGVEYDIVPDKNVRFIYNLCTRFPSQ